MGNEFSKINIALLPPEDIQHLAIETSKHLAKKYQCSFQLDQEHLPHISLYAGEFPYASISTICASLADLAKISTGIGLIITDFELTGSYYVVNFKKSDELLDLHQKVLARINPLRMGHQCEKYLPESKDFLALSLIRQNLVLQYGSPFVAEMFHPHLTLTKFMLESTIMPKDTEWFIRGFNVHKLIVSEMGEHGTCTKIIEEFTLAN